MPVGASPQLLFSAQGPHTPGAVAKISAIIFEHSGSIVATRKAILHENCTLMMSVWVPPTGSSPAVLAADLEKVDLGLAVQTVLLPEVDAAPAESCLRRMVLECPQRPGIVLAITELLKDHGCILSDMDTETSAKHGEIWFRLECIVEAPGTSTTQLEDTVSNMVDLSSREATIAFDSLRTDRFQPLSHA